jgi:UDP:flavonoid glycosyltransferase YjiC (YdhE family)
VQVVFTCVPGHGHLNPMVPLARELEGKGCDVRFVTGRQLASRVEALGFRCYAAGPTLADMQSNALADPDVRAALDTQPWVAAAAIFGGRARPVVEDLDGADLSPDLVIHDAMELAGPFIAARSGVPWVTHGLGPRWPALVEDAIPSFVDGYWRDNGLEPAPRGGLGRHAYVEICPPAVRSDNGRGDDRVIESRSIPLDEPATPLPPHADGARPYVYCTLGTFSNSNRDVFRVLLEAVASLDVDVLLTTGWGIELDDLRVIPENVVIKEYVPQAQVLDRAALVVCHGGSGTMLAALGAGLPIVALPQGADQFVNAPWWQRSGAVMVLQPPDADAASIASTVSSALASSAMRAAAELMASDIAAMPSPSESADKILELARR